MCCLGGSARAIRGLELFTISLTVRAQPLNIERVENHWSEAQLHQYSAVPQLRVLLRLLLLLIRSLDQVIVFMDEKKS